MGFVAKNKKTETFSFSLPCIAKLARHSTEEASILSVALPASRGCWPVLLLV
jgi:hypothetical protein